MMNETSRPDKPAIYRKGSGSTTIPTTPLAATFAPSADDKQMVKVKQS